jgi:predicted N-acetyltransferase YhbS
LIRFAAESFTMKTDLPVSIHHLFEVPEHRQAIAELIHHEFWTDVPGASVEAMAARLATADSIDRVPLCLVALHQSQPIAVVNLVEEDDERQPQWSPWLAGMVVAAEWRGRGVGRSLVRRLLVEASRLKFKSVYFGTDGPGFYTRLGAVEQAQPQADFWFMRFDLQRAA